MAIKKQGNYLEQILLHIHKKITQKHWYSKKASYMTHCPALKYAKRTCFKTGCLLIAVFTLSGKHMLTYIVPPFFYYFHFTRHIICCQSRFYCFPIFTGHKGYITLASSKCFTKKQLYGMLVLKPCSLRFYAQPGILFKRNAVKVML